MLRRTILALATTLLLASAAVAQPYPSKPIKFVIPFGPGSATDLLARVVAQDLTASLGQPVVILHKPGADGSIAGVEVVRSAPDGYTFLFGSNSPLAVMQLMRKQPPYDALKDFTPISMLGGNTFFLLVSPTLPVKSLAELVAHAKANPKTLNYAAGNTYALASLKMLSKTLGIEIEPIPYKSEPDAVVDLMSGQVHIMNTTSSTAIPQVKAGKLNAVATMLGQRSPLLPDVPSIVEFGLKTLPIEPWFALVGPAGLPADIVQRMNKEVAASLAKPQVRALLLPQGFIPRSSTPEELATYMKDQVRIWAAALKDAGVEPQ